MSFSSARAHQREVLPVPSYSHPAGCVDLCGIESSHVSHPDDAHLDLVIPFEAMAATSACERHRGLVRRGEDSLRIQRGRGSAVSKGDWCWGAGVSRIHSTRRSKSHFRWRSLISTLSRVEAEARSRSRSSVCCTSRYQCLISITRDDDDGEEDEEVMVTAASDSYHT